MFALLAFLPQLATGAGWLKVGKFLIQPRNLLRFAAIIAIVFALHKGYNWIYDRGMAKQQAIDAPIIAKLTKERNEIKGKYDTLHANVTTWKAQSAEADRVFKADQKLIVDGLERQLKESERKRKQQQKDLQRDLPKYIPASVDIALPVGFLWLQNRSIEGQAAGSQNGLPGSTGVAADTPSGLTLRGYSEHILIPNNDEAVRRGEIVLGWQQWYAKTRLNFTEAQRKAAEAIPKLEDTKPAAKPVTPPAAVPSASTPFRTDAGPPSVAVAIASPPLPPDDEF